MSPARQPHDLMRQLTEGRLTRRAFIARAPALGFSASAIAGFLAACGGTAATPTSAPTATRAASGTTPAATAAATTAPSAATAAGSPTRPGSPVAGASPAASPAAGGGVRVAQPPANPGKRGGGGALKLLWWQSPTILNNHLAQGQKDTDASRPVYEPLAVIDAEGAFIPILAAEIPTVENGGISADYKTVTWKLKPGVKWSDGEPFTAKDVVFTWEYVTDKDTAATTSGPYKVIDKVEAVNDTTARITFTSPQTGWFNVFVNQNGLVLPEHVFRAGKGAPAKNFPANLKPVGTGPYKVDDFKPGDQVTYSINPTFRDPQAPFFDSITLKGGGDAPSAARAVLQTGDYDFAWNLQVDAAVLDQLEQTGGKGIVETTPGASTERLLINFTDPNKEVDGERASLKAPHPFLVDKAVRQALALACDRQTVVDTLYKKAGAVGHTILFNPPQYNSPNTKSEFNAQKAELLLEDAGYKKSGQYRAKGSVQLSVVYQTTVNAVRQKTQQVLKDTWEKIGVKTELKSIDSGVFFSSDAGNPDTGAHFYTDIEMFTDGNVSPDPYSYMEQYTTGQIAQKANQWSGNNYMRWSNKDYDDTIDQLKKEFDPTKRAQLFIKANDIHINDYAQIPLVHRAGVFGRAKTLQIGPGTTWDSNLWNVANWKR